MSSASQFKLFFRQRSSAQLRRNFEVPDMKYLRYQHWNRWPYWELRDKKQIYGKPTLIFPDFVLLIWYANREISIQNKIQENSSVIQMILFEKKEKLLVYRTIGFFYFFFIN